jgi:flagellar FliL protein
MKWANQTGKFIKTRRGRGTLAIIVVLLGAIVGYCMVAQKAPGTESEAHEEGEPRETKGNRTEIGPEFAFDAFIVNIAGTNNHRFLKCIMSVEFDDKAGVAEAAAKAALLRDSIIDVLSSKTLEELEPGEPRGVLRSELVSTVDEQIEKASVKRVFFSEFVIQ